MRDAPAERRSFDFEFELPGINSVCGTFFAYDGEVESITFDDGEYLETGPGGRTIDKARSPFLRELGREVLRLILANQRDDIDETKPVESWTAYAPAPL